MKKIAIILLLISLAILIFFSVLILLDKSNQKLLSDSTEKKVASFEECVELGNAVSSTVPPQCETKDGLIFTKENFKEPNLVNKPRQPELTEVESSTGEISEGGLVDNSGANANSIKLTNLSANQVITSPLLVEGMATADWFYRGDFTVLLYDASGNRIAFEKAVINEEVREGDLVGFVFSISFPFTGTSKGYLVFKKSNPTGNDELDYKVKLPVKFKARD